jgi:hypothetical protein
MTVIAPTQAQMQHAFAALRGADWPATLAELQLDTTPLATARLGTVLGAARCVAQGGDITRADLSGPITNRPARPAPHPLPTRRHGDAAVDIKRIASGDRDDE